MTHPTTAYAQDVLSGNIIAGPYVRKAAKRHLGDLQHSKSFYFDEGAADHVFDFFRYLRHIKGEWANNPVELEPWQKFIVGSLFGWKRYDDETRRYRTAYVEVPRKNGKSTLISGIGLYLLAADMEGGAEVFSAATKKDQAKIVFDDARRMSQRSPVLKNHVSSVQNNLSMEITASKFEPLGADSDTMDGLNVHGALVDELHAHKTRKVWDVLETATGARTQPMIIGITTAGFNRYSICYEQKEYSEKILNKVLNDDSYFSYMSGIDEDDDWSDENTWKKANPNYGISVKADDLERKVSKAKAMPAALNNFLTKHLNVWTSQEEKWISIESWKASAGKLPKTDGQSCFMGIDLASKTDLTAAVMLFPQEDDSYVVKPHFFIPEEAMYEAIEKQSLPYDVWERDGYLTATPGNVIDYEFLKSYINKMARQYNIEEIAFDPWNSSQIAVDLQNDGHKLVEVRQGYKSLSEATKELEALVLSKRLIHGDHPVLTWNMDNLVVTTDPAGNIKPDKAKATQKIDGAVAMITGLSRAILSKQGGSIYNVRGIRSL